MQISSQGDREQFQAEVKFAMSQVLRKGNWAVPVGILVLLLLSHGSTFLSHAESNTGQLALVRILTATSGKPSLEAILSVKMLMHKAVVLDRANKSAHRGLGWVMAVQGEEAKAADEWRFGGFTAQNFVNVGREAYALGWYEEALRWYVRAINAEPRLGDSWYHIGLVYEGMERWEEALKAYRHAVEIGHFTRVGRSSPHYRMGVLYQWRLEHQQVEKALAAYEAAIETDDFSATWEAADCHYKRGEILAWIGGDPDEYVREYQRAIELNPDHVRAHSLLGVAYYAHYKDLAMAEAEIQRALELSPHNKRAYVHLGDIYRQEGRTNEAAKMYGRALDIDPEFELAHQQLLLLQQDVE